MAISSAFPSKITPNSRIGFHYFPDTLHYREADLQTWLPELQELGASWLVLRSEQNRAIPEQFLRGLKRAGIEPIIQFPLSLEPPPVLEEIRMLLEVYARWGARYLVFYDRPNARSAWPAAGWAQQDLVERFLDRYLPAAGLALQLGQTPVFPPLEPGGSYWDTAFLRSALLAMQRRKQEALLQRLVLSAYAWTGEALPGADSNGDNGAKRRSLDWGAGGPERWPQTRPYQIAKDSQDQRGFRIFDWYQAVARSVLHQDCPVILFGAGLPGNPQAGGACDPQEQAVTCTSIARLLAGETVMDPLVEANALELVPQQVVCANFWLLSADPASPYFDQAWYENKEKKRPAANMLRAWRRDSWWRDQAQENRASADRPTVPVTSRSIRHYLLLPGYEWGVSDWYLEVIRPFIKKHRPTVGFSLEEAEKAARVTVVGNPQNYPEDLLFRLQKAGCQIEQIGGDGTNIATELSER